MNSIVKILREPTNRRELSQKRLEKQFRIQAKKQGGRMVDLKESTQESQLEDTKKAIFAIEGLFHAVNSTTFSPRFMDGLRIGLEYIGQLHGRLIAQIGPEEVEKMKQQNQPVMAAKPPEVLRPN